MVTILNRNNTVYVDTRFEGVTVRGMHCPTWLQGSLSVGMCQECVRADSSRLIRELHSRWTGMNANPTEQYFVNARTSCLMLPGLTRKAMAQSAKIYKLRMLAVRYLNKLHLAAAEVKENLSLRQRLGSATPDDVMAFGKEIANNANSADKFLADLCQNHGRHDNGKRWAAQTKSVLLVAMIQSGKQALRTLSANFNLPSVTTIEREHRRLLKDTEFHLGLDIRNLRGAARIMRASADKIGLDSVVISFAEDETRVAAALQRDVNVLMGGCGKEGESHVCRWQHDVKEYLLCLDSGGTSNPGLAARTKELFETLRAAKHIRVIIMNGHHPKLPEICVAVIPTCLCFNSSWVEEQWNFIESFRDEFRKVGLLIVGFASDGASTRMKLMRRDALVQATVHHHRMGIDHATFLYTCMYDINKNGQRVGVRRLHDPDPIHIVKRMCNHLLSTVRILTPTRSCPSSRLCILEDFLLCDSWDELEARLGRSCPSPGLRKRDPHRPDRQDFHSAQRILMGRVRSCLTLAASERGLNQDAGLVSLRWLLHLFSVYMDVFFCSWNTSLIAKVAQASYVYHSLLRWGDNVSDPTTGARSLGRDQSFLTKQTFMDACHSLHSAVLRIIFHREFSPETPVSGASRVRPLRILFLKDRWFSCQRSDLLCKRRVFPSKGHQLAERPRDGRRCRSTPPSRENDQHLAQELLPK